MRILDQAFTPNWRYGLRGDSSMVQQATATIAMTTLKGDGYEQA